MRLLTILLLIFLVFSGFLIVKYNNYKFNNPQDVISFTSDYGRWLFGVGKSGANVVGAAINEQWLPQNTSEINTTDSEQINQSDETRRVRIIYE
ncbi:MAG: hypothetical protein ACMXYG_04025 [Candidatus Woesearchaeota archaeon]